MIQDSEKHTFQGILVYQLDRFARNRYDSAINKAKLKKNGVRVLSARENITEDASGILIEGVLESMAEYYSVELSQKINRGMQINASKCLSSGGKPVLDTKSTRIVDTMLMRKKQRSSGSSTKTAYIDSFAIAVSSSARLSAYPVPIHPRVSVLF